MGLSLKEKQRRYLLVREKMKEQGLSALLAFSNAQINQQGFVRYFTNLPIPIFSHALLFPIEGTPILLTPSSLQTFWAKELSWVPEENIHVSKSFGEDLGRHLVALKLQNKEVGVASFRSLSTRDYQGLSRLCPNIDLVDATEFLENIRSVKSAEELRLIEKSAQIAELAQETFLTNLKPGVKERELVAKVEEAVRANGAERTFYLISSNPLSIYPYIPRENRIEKGRPIIFSVELSGPEGYWSQMVRTFFWGRPEGVFERLYMVAEELKLVIQEGLRPGCRVSEVAERLRRIIYERGFESGVHFGHALGLDVTEEPEVSLESQRIFMRNQAITIHPHLIAKEEPASIWFGDMYAFRETDTKILTPYLSSGPSLLSNR